MVKALLFAMPDYIPRFDVVVRGPNLAIVSLAGNVDPGVCDVKVADLLLIRRRMDKYILGLLREHSPDLVGLTCMSFQYHSAVKIAKLVKSYDKNIRIT
jgi:anaerobic magnesium-protoporphyrin IX monomethyl ester cyclase